MKSTLYPNLKAEQSRAGLTNQMVANAIGISRVTYESKKKSGRFDVSESKKLCELFKCEFDYLFAVITNQPDT